MKKLLLLLFLIPVLSWADCPTQMPEWKDNKGKLLNFTEEQNAYYSNLHCEMHRCYKKEIEELHKEFPERKGMDEISPACVCKNLGGLTSSHTPDEYFGCYDMKKILQGDGSPGGGIRLGTSSLKDFHTHADPEPKPTPTTTPTISIDDAKSQCTDIGFKTGTERFGDCVLELMQ